MSRRKKRSGKGTDKRKLAALETPDVRQEAERTVMHDIAHDMNTTVNQPDDARAAAAEAGVQEPRVASDPIVAAAGEADRNGEEDSTQTTLGERLRSARESRGWSIDDVGRHLHLPVQIIQTLESEQFDRIGYGIYLRGYLGSYARLVDVPAVLVDATMRGRSEPPPLVASGTISHSRYLYQRYSVSALYVILTGVIIVPAVLLAMRAGLQPASVAALASLDLPPKAAAHASPGSANPSTREQLVTAQQPLQAGANGSASPASDTPLVASIAPFSALGRKEKTAASSATPSVPATPPNQAPVQAQAARATAPGVHTLRLALKEASWVEVQTAAGEKLEYGLLPAGTTRTYSSADVLEVRIGNVNGAEVEVDGQAQDLAPYRHANVAHFKLFVPGEIISRTDS